MADSAQFPQRVRFGAFEVDLRAGELWKSGRKRKLTGQPFSVLAILLERPGEVISREELQKRLWPDTFVDVDHNLNAAVNKIREALDDSPERPRIIERCRECRKLSIQRIGLWDRKAFSLSTGAKSRASISMTSAQRALRGRFRSTDNPTCGAASLCQLTKPGWHILR